jgi:hypothetical protein
MFDSATTKLLRVVLDEVCSGISLSEISLRTHVASKLLECAQKGESSIEELQRVGRQALRAAPALAQ